MNYIKYLQAGGAVNDPVEQVYAALMQDPEGTLKQLDSMGEKGQQILQALLQKHPELQQAFGGVPQEEKGGEVPKAQIGAAIYNEHTNNPLSSDTTYTYEQPGKRDGNIFTPTPAQRRIIDSKFDNTPSVKYKCGGKVKKGEKGLPIPAKKVVKNAKGGCPCQLKKVGGKLVEVDSCTGKIVK